MELESLRPMSYAPSISRQASSPPGSETVTSRRRYRRALAALTRERVPFQVGGAFALEHYIGVVRWTKDLDIFLRPRDVSQALETLASAGFQTELPYPHWLGKARAGRDFIDLIFSSGNGVAEVDDEWIANGVPGVVIGMSVHLSPPEEMIWSKAFVAERERYDGADVAHLIRACHAELNWDRLLARFGPHWRLLLSHLVLFEFVYPSEHAPRARAMTRALARRIAEDGLEPVESERVCLGTLLSRAQYLPDLTAWGYADGRVPPRGRMTEEDVRQWTAAIHDKEESPDANRGGG